MKNKHAGIFILSAVMLLGVFAAAFCAPLKSGYRAPLPRLLFFFVDDYGLPIPMPSVMDGVSSKSYFQCERMQAEVKAVKKEFEGKLKVRAIDLRHGHNRIDRAKYDIKTVPALIFFDPDGDELFRCEGYMSREEIAARWYKAGYPLGEADTGR